MNIYLLIICIIYSLFLTIDLIEHGKEQVFKINFYKRLIGNSIMLTLIFLAINK